MGDLPTHCICGRLASERVFTPEGDPVRGYCCGRSINSPSGNISASDFAALLPGAPLRIAGVEGDWPDADTDPPRAVTNLSEETENG